METIPTFPKLYKKNNKQTISIWEIGIQPVVPNSKYELEWRYGILGGTLTTHKKQIENGKAGRTPLQQAILECQSKWNEKRNRETYSETLPSDTTPTQTNHELRPMLAVTLRKDLYDKNNTSKAYKIPFPCFVQRKYDGIRAISYFDPARRDVVIQSRKGVVFHNFSHLCSQLKVLFEKIEGSSSIVLDGELYTPQLTFEQLSGLVRLHEGNVSREDMANIQKIEYHIYDVYDSSKPSLSYEERMNFIDHIFSAWGSEISLIQKVETEVASDFEDIQTKHNQYVNDGFEGIIIRDKKGIYEPNKRSKYLQKYKEFMDDEFEIVGYGDGVGIDQGLCIWECVTKDGKRFSVKPKGTHEYRKMLFENGANYIGKMLTVIFQEYSDIGVPRFPVGKSIRDEY